MCIWLSALVTVLRKDRAQRTVPAAAAMSVKQLNRDAVLLAHALVSREFHHNEWEVRECKQNAPSTRARSIRVLRSSGLLIFEATCEKRISLPNCWLPPHFSLFFVRWSRGFE